MAVWSRFPNLVLTLSIIFSFLNRLPLQTGNDPPDRSIAHLHAGETGWEPVSLKLELPLPEAEPLTRPTSEADPIWTTIMREDFEGAFPTTGWTVLDASTLDGTEYYWAKESYNPHSGSYSAWAAGGGADGVDPAVSGYPNNMLSYMIYGPFSMVGAKDAVLTFSYWNDSESKDVLSVSIAIDSKGSSWKDLVRYYGNSNGWQTISLDLASTSSLSLANVAVVRVTFVFDSDSSNSAVPPKKGPFIDDVELKISAGPDITFFTPANLSNPWSGPIVASSTEGTHQTTPLNTHEDTYIDWAFINQGAGTSTIFTNCLYLNDALAACEDISEIGEMVEKSSEDVRLEATPPAGTVKLKVIFDVNNTIDEADETNNIIEMEFQWNLPQDKPDLLPHAPPGWTYPVVPALEKGNTNYFSLYTGQDTYINWSVINRSAVAVTDTFDTCLFLDSNLVDCWPIEQSLSAEQSFSRTDLKLLDSPTQGQHVLRLVVDANDAIDEANEYNNVWERRFTWYQPGTCGPFVPQFPETPILPDGSWSSLPLTLPPAPQMAVVGEVSLKFALEHPDPNTVEVFLAHGTGPDRVRITGQDLSDGRQASVTIPDFAGQPAEGTWTVWLRDPIPGRSGRLASASLVVHPVLPSQMLPAVDGQGQPAAFRLPETAPGIRLTANSEALPLAFPANYADKEPDWRIIFFETFEDDFPSSSGWTFEDRQDADGCEYYWGIDSANSAPGGGFSAGWPASGGADGLNSNPGVNLYPPNMDSWMIFGPFYMSGTAEARLSFDLYRNIEPVHDYLFVGASGDGVNFSGLTYSGLQDWKRISMDLSDFANNETVWIAFRFVSDPSNQSDGPWIDNILLERWWPNFLPVIAR